MSRYDIITGKKRDKSLNKELLNDVEHKVLKLTPTEDDLLFIMVPEADVETLNKIDRTLRKFNFKIIITNKFVDVKKVDLKGVKALNISTDMNSVEVKKLKDTLWRNITGQR